MKILSMTALALLLSMGVAQAETMQGKILTQQNDTVQVRDDNNTIKTLKTNDKTHYFSKRKENASMGYNSARDGEAMVEIIYSYDPQTGEMIVDELTWMTE